MEWLACTFSVLHKARIRKNAIQKDFDKLQYIREGGPKGALIYKKSGK